MTVAAYNGSRSGRADSRKVALVVRVSTDRQAMNPEGSLKTQLQRLRSHIDYKRTGCGEDWTEAGVYELRGVSGKDSMRSEEYAELFADIRAGRVDTVLCTALERLCRSVKDFLWFFEFINEHGVEFVCLRQNYDTTTPQGKLFVTIMMALAEFEREQTSERTRDAVLARAERGLWNGGQLLGYDLDADRKGYLIPNEGEVALVNFAFDTYLACGSMKKTVEALNGGGYRTKVYLSRRGKVHPGAEFNFSSVQYLLKNPAYIGKKELNKGPKSKAREYQVVQAVWPSIVDEAKFGEAQRLMAANNRTCHNGAAFIRHPYVLSGLLHCGRCRSSMEGRSGTGRLGVRYFYYVCTDEGCGLRVTAGEVEAAVVGRIQTLAQEPGIIDRLVGETNARLQRQAPALAKRKKVLEKSLNAVKASADKVFLEWSRLDGAEARAFLGEKLGELAQRRSELEAGLAETERALPRAAQRAVDAQAITRALESFGAVYECLKPYEQKELVKIVLNRAEVSDRKIVLEINGNVPALAETSTRSDSRFGIPNWLPGEDSNLEPSG